MFKKQTDFQPHQITKLNRVQYRSIVAASLNYLGSAPPNRIYGTLTHQPTSYDQDFLSLHVRKVSLDCLRAHEIVLSLL
jgi:hypothetical protein